MPESSPRVLIAGDQPIFREALGKLLEAEPGFTVVGQASNVTEAVRLARELTPDVLLLDLTQPGLSGLEALRELTASPRPCRVILLTAAIQRDEICGAFELGVQGVITKGSTTALLLKSIRCVMADQYWIGSETVSDLLEYLHLDHRLAVDRACTQDKFHLTTREMEVVAMIIGGYSNREIAHKLSLSQNTVKHRLSSIFAKLGVSDRLQLALFAIRHRLVDDQTSVLPRPSLPRLETRALT